MVSMMYVKVHSTENGNILAMCDSPLIDKVLTEGDIEINIRDYADFYKGQLLSKDSAKSTISKVGISSANIIGEESIWVALERQIIEKKNVKTVMKVPYANAFSLK
jgi:hypothetical protein